MVHYGSSPMVHYRTQNAGRPTRKNRTKQALFKNARSAPMVNRFYILVHLPPFSPDRVMLDRVNLDRPTLTIMRI